MCLYVKNYNSNGSHIKTSTENIKVYKRFYAETQDEDLLLSSPHQDYEYHLGYNYKLSTELDNGSIIYEGFHAYTSKHHATSIAGSREIIITCIIPKGAKYIIGYDAEIVSDQLITPKSIKYQGYEYNINY